MNYLSSNSHFPLSYVSSGILTSGPGFVHLNRNIEDFVFILVLKGTLPITQEDRVYNVKENEFILLFGNMHHFGHMPGPDELTYYWVHFHMTDPDYRICNHHQTPEEYVRYNASATPETFPAMNHFFIPEYGTISGQKRSVSLFSDLIHTAKSERHHGSWRCHYALSALLLEITYETLNTNHSSAYIRESSVENILEYIHFHYEKNLSVAEIAKQFNYSPTYLTKVIKAHTGVPLIVYINQTRMEAAKNLLRNSDVTIQRISAMCGFENEKYFFRIFKKTVGMSPSSYRKKYL